MGLGGALLGSVLVGCGGTAGTPAPADLELPVAFGLTRDGQGLLDAALARSTPGTAEYQQWLTAEEIASFGAAPAAAARVWDTVSAAGFEGAVDASRGLVLGSMSVVEAEEFFDVEMVMAEGQVPVVKPASTPRVPRVLRDQVTEVVGLTLAVAPDAPAPPESSPTTLSADPPCPNPVPLSQQLTEVYGLAPLHEAGRGGQGVTIGMLQIDQTSQHALDLFSRCFDVPIPPVTTVKVDSSDPAVFGFTAEESTLDIVAASLLAPNVEAIRTYQFNPRSSILFPLATAVADGLAPNGPQVISTSIGVCDSALRREAIDLTEWVLAAGAAAGLTVVASAGDTGSSGCAPSTTEEASQYPASSPLVLAVGGTEFEQSDGVRREQVWNDSPAIMQAGGGAGVSALRRPDYQRGLAGGDRRLVPDVAFVAAPATFGPIPVCSDDGQCEHKVVGGTSATAPGLAGAISELSDALAAPGDPPRRLGLLNPRIYALAADPATASILRDVTVGTNDLYGVGCCTAAAGYDAASGWGSVDFAALLTYLRSQPSPGQEPR